MSGRISVCIPTYCRPESLRIAVKSVFAQTYQDIEILIGDDSPDENTTKVISELRASSPHQITSFHNMPGLGQNANVNSLLQHASGSRIVILHDDDLLMPEALTIMDKAWEEDTVVVFGTQEIVNASGSLLIDETIEINSSYLRTPKYVGRQAFAVESALRQQIPNDGFLVDAALAKSVGYRPEEQVGVYCDLDFNLRVTLAKPAGGVIYLGVTTSQYRISPDAISTSDASKRHEHPKAGALLYDYVRNISLPAVLEPARSCLLARLAQNAVKGYALVGKRLDALHIYLSRSYMLSRPSLIKRLYHAFFIAQPKLVQHLRSR